MEKEVKIAIVAGVFTILAVIIAYLLPILFSNQNLEITEFGAGVCPIHSNIHANYTYTCLNFQIKNTGNEIAIINGVLIKVLSCSIRDNSTKTSSHPRLSKNDLPSDTYLVELQADRDYDLMNEISMYMYVDMYYPLPPQSSKEFHIVLDTDKTAAYCIVPYVVYDNHKKIKCTTGITLILGYVNINLSEVYPTTIERINNG